MIVDHQIQVRADGFTYGRDVLLEHRGFPALIQIDHGVAPPGLDGGETLRDCGLRNFGRVPSGICPNSVAHRAAQKLIYGDAQGFAL